VIVRFWGTRGSLAAPGPETVHYGGDTSTVEVRSAATGDRSVVVLDAGTGIRRLGEAIEPDIERVDVLLSHLHMDHIQGLGFFAPLFRPGLEVHVWGPASLEADLGSRLRRYLSPPLFPTRLHELPCDLHIHDLPSGVIDIPGMTIDCDFVCHPGLTVGFRLDDGVSTMAYLPDHEPALGAATFPSAPAWTSGFDLAHQVDLLIHDAQYTDAEYAERIGWGHSTVGHAAVFASHVGARRLAAFHHDPTHDDATIESLLEVARATAAGTVEVFGAAEAFTLDLDAELSVDPGGALDAHIEDPL
jgi:phosphoribosyl 1,2-cyclic phosphodiesterase